MPQVESEWEINQEAEKLIEKLVETYPEKLGHIGHEEIGCAQIVNKDRPDSWDYDSKLVGVKAPGSLYCPKKYIIWWHKNTWDSYTPAQRAAMLMAKLLRIPDPMDGSVLKEDLKDVKCMVRSFGVDYMQNPNLPDLSEMKQPL
jgi:hypothetical protein